MPGARTRRGIERLALRVAALAALTVLLAACGVGAGADAGGTAELWVTHDRGAEVVLAEAVPAGLTVLQALDRVAEVKTRYGGRFVQAIEGLEGSLAHQRDWFYFVNGIEPDVGGAEVRLGPGDIAWWDFRSWAGEDEEQPVVVGAFPEPFLHGWAGTKRPAEIVAPPELSAEAAALEGLLAHPGEGEPGTRGAALSATRGPGNGDPVTFTLAGSLEAVRAAARALAADPSIVRYRYEARFDERGEVVG